MSELRDLYQEVILDHCKNPRNFQPLDDADASADGHNPLCGDKLKVYVRTKDGKVEAVGFEGSGCAISTASASMMTENLQGKTIEEAEKLFEGFQELATSGAAPTDVGKLMVFSGVSEFPMRVKCATLPWHTMSAALAQSGDDVTTE